MYLLFKVIINKHIVSFYAHIKQTSSFYLNINQLLLHFVFHRAVVVYDCFRFNSFNNSTFLFHQKTHCRNPVCFSISCFLCGFPLYSGFSKRFPPFPRHQWSSYRPNIVLFECHLFSVPRNIHKFRAKHND